MTGWGQAGLGESLIWDSDDTPSLQNPLPRAVEPCFRGESRVTAGKKKEKPDSVKTNQPLFYSRELQK